MTITNNWTAPWGSGAANWIDGLSKTRKVIPIEMQGHGRAADIRRDFSYENLAEDVAALLDHLNTSLESQQRGAHRHRALVF